MPFLEDYEKIQRIGEGAFATVYKVRHAQLGYIRAIKVSKGFIEDTDDKAWQTFLEECKMLLRIGNGSHPNIVRIYQPRLLEHRAVVEMDCVEGKSLHDYIKKVGFVPFSEFVTFAHQIVGALAYCHVDLYKFQMDPVQDHLTPDPEDGLKYLVSPEKEKALIEKYSVVHNDLHSANIIRRDYDGQYVLLDFGLAIQDTHCVKSSSRFDGAIEYCAPEKLERGLVQPASDVYALGILLYEMLAGQVPFPYDISDGTSPESARNRVYQQQLNEAPAPILPKRKAAFEAAHPGQTYSRDYPEAVDAVIMRCLAKDPADRYPNAKALFTALEQALKTQPAPEPAPVAPVAPAPTPAKQSTSCKDDGKKDYFNVVRETERTENSGKGGLSKTDRILLTIAICYLASTIIFLIFKSCGYDSVGYSAAADSIDTAAMDSVVYIAPEAAPETPEVPVDSTPADKNVEQEQKAKPAPEQDKSDAPQEGKQGTNQERKSRDATKKEVNDKAIINVTAPPSAYYGERFTVTVKVENSDSNTSVKIKRHPKIDGCTLLYGPLESTQSSYSMIKGKAESTFTKLFTYTFRADRTGPTTMTAVGIDVDGRMRYSGSKKIYVYPPRERDAM